MGSLAVAVIGVLLTVATVRVIEERNIAREALLEAEARSNALVLAHAGRSSELDPTEAATWLAAYPADGAEPDRMFALAQDVVSRGIAQVAVPSREAPCDKPLFSGDGQGVFTLGTSIAWVEATTGAVTGPLQERQAYAGVAVGPTDAIVAAGASQILRVGPGTPARVFATVPGVPTAVGTDGVAAFVGEREGAVRRVDLASGATELLATSGGRILGLFVETGTWTAASADGSVWTGSTEGGAATRVFQSKDALSSVAALQDGRFVLGDSAGGVTLVEPGGASVALGRLGGSVRLLAAGNQGRLLVAADSVGGVRLFDVRTGETLDSPVPWAQSTLLGLAVSPTDDVVIAVPEDGVLHFWRPSTGDEVIRRQRGKMAEEVVFSGDGTRLATCTVDSQLRLWPVPTLRGRVYHGHQAPVFHPTFLPDGRLATDSDDQTVYLWPAEAGPGKALSGHRDRVYGLEVSPDGRHLASAGRDGRVFVWDSATGTGVPLDGHEGRIRRAIFTSDGQRVLTGGRDGTLRAWSLDGAALQVTHAHEGGVHWLALADDGATVWSAGPDRTIKHWDPGTGALREVASHLGPGAENVLRVFPLPGDRVLTCPDDRSAAIVSADGAVRTLPAPGEMLCAAVVLSPDRRFAAAPAGEKVWILDVERGGWRDFGWFPAEIHAAAWSPDGRLLALAGLDGTARLVRIADEASAIVLQRESGVLGVALSADGAQLAVTGIDRTVWVGPVDETALLPRDPAALLRVVAERTRSRFDDVGL